MNPDKMPWRDQLALVAAKAGMAGFPVYGWREDGSGFPRFGFWWLGEFTGRVYLGRTGREALTKLEEEVSRRG